MAKARSPRYPAIGLPEAIEKVRAVYDNDFTNEVPKEVVAAHMGYGGLNGASLGVISAVSKFGLLVGGGKGMRVSDRALAILVNEPGHPDRADAIREAAAEPALFAELFQQFPNGASDQNLKSYLITRMKFLPSAVEGAIRAFRSTESLVQKECGVRGSFPIREYEVPSNSPSNDTAVAPRGEKRGGFGGVPTARSLGGVVSTSEPEYLRSGPEIGFFGDVIRLSGIISSQAEADKVIGLLTAMKPFLAANVQQSDDTASDVFE